MPQKLSGGASAFSTKTSNPWSAIVLIYRLSSAASAVYAVRINCCKSWAANDFFILSISVFAVLQCSTEKKWTSARCVCFALLPLVLLMALTFACS